MSDELEKRGENIPDVSTFDISSMNLVQLGRQLKENLKAADVADQLTPAVMEELEKIFG